VLLSVTPLIHVAPQPCTGGVSNGTASVRPRAAAVTSLGAASSTARARATEERSREQQIASTGCPFSPCSSLSRKVGIAADAVGVSRSGPSDVVVCDGHVAIMPCQYVSHNSHALRQSAVAFSVPPSVGAGGKSDRTFWGSMRLPESLARTDRRLTGRCDAWYLNSKQRGLIIRGR
jgi:hypothetical protein